MKNAWTGRALALALAATACSAQAQGAEEPRMLPEVSVTATRVERDSMDVPAAIDTIDQVSIREGNPQVNLSESLNRVPGIVVQNRQNYAQDLQMSSRGFGARSTFGVRGLRLIADGIPATMPDGQGQAASFNLSSARNIEVLRGPFSSLYGNAAGGVVQIVTADGPKMPTLSFSGLYGSYDTSKLGAQYGGQHGPLNMLVDASRFQTDGYRDHSAARRDHVNAKFKYDLGSAGVLTLVLNALDQPETQDPLGLTAAQFAQNPRQVAGVALQFNTRKSVTQTQAGMTYEINLSSADKLNARVYGGDRQVTQYLAIPLAVQAAATHSGGVVDLDRGYGGVGLRWTHERRIGGSPFSISAGMDYDRMKERRRGFINNLGVSGALKRDEDNTVSNTDFYAQAEWQLSRLIGVMAGVRHSRVKFDSNDYFVVGTNGNDSGGQDYSRTTPVAGITLKLTPTLNAYANLGRGFETPTFAELAYRPGGAAGLNFALKPSNSVHREIGLKALLGERGRLNLALFRIDTRDEIVVESASGGRTVFKNASGTKREGFELAWDYRLPRGFEAALAYTWLDATFKEGFTSSGPVNPGNRLPGVAPQLLYGELVWRHAASGFHAGVEVKQSGRIYVNDQNAEFAGSYTVWNLRAGMQQRGRNWKFTEFVRLDNIGDKRYAGSVIVGDGNGRYYEPAPGRNYMVGINAQLNF